MLVAMVHVRSSPAACSVVAALAAALIGCGNEDVSLPCAGAVCAGSTTGGGGAGGGEPAIECPASGVYHGPWVIRPTETGASIRWDACAEGPAGVVITPEAGGADTAVAGTQTASEVKTRYDVSASVPPDLPGTYWLTEAVATGLEPGRCYRYRLDADDTLGGRFCTSRPSGDPLVFMGIGDTNPALGATDGVLAYPLAQNPDFTLHMGDIQYYASVFESYVVWFPIMQPMLSQGAFLPVVGNHESELPHEFEDYYLRYWGGAAEGPRPEDFHYASAGVHFFGVDTELSLDEGSEQAEWLVAALDEAQKTPGFRFSVVTMHKTLITCGDTSQDSGARDYLEPIFKLRGVRLVLQGHMHGYERFEADGLTYITTGGGGGALGDVDANVADRPEQAAIRAAAFASYNAVTFEVGPGTLVATVTDDSGAILDGFSHPVP